MPLPRTLRPTSLAGFSAWVAAGLVLACGPAKEQAPASGSEGPAPSTPELAPRAAQPGSEREAPAAAARQEPSDARTLPDPVGTGDGEVDGARSDGILVADGDVADGQWPEGWVPLTEFEGEPVDVVRVYHDDGTLQRITCHLAGQRGPGSQHGPDWECFPNRVPRSKQVWRHGVLEGPFALFWNNGLLKQEGVYVAGERHGTYLQYFRSGDRQMELEYDHGEPHGAWREWYGGGQPALEEHYDHGVLNGVRKTWQRSDTADVSGSVTGGDSIPQVEETYVAGVLEGPWTDYWPRTGVIRRTGEMRAGLKVGSWRAHHESGVLKAEREFVDGVQHGSEVLYDEGGAKIAENHFVDGLQTGTQTAWYPSGQLQATGEMENALRQGPWTYYLSDGSIDPTWTGTYKDGQRVGD